jgi:hypothetical protein
MSILRIILSIIGFLMVLAGIVWAAQGSGIFPYPAGSFMINQTKWIFYGIVMAVAGAIVVYLAQRMGTEGDTPGSTGDEGL